MRRGFGRFRDHDQKPKEKYFKPERRPNQAENIPDLDFSNSDRKIWLVKVPDFLAKKWENTTEENVELGRLRLYTSPATARGTENKKFTLKLSVPDAGEMEGDDEEVKKAHVHTDEDGKQIPDEYVLEMTEQFNDVQSAMVVFSHGRAPPHPAAIEGYISQRYNLKPVDNAAYRQILARRLEEHRSKEKVLLVDNNDVVRASNQSLQSWTQVNMSRRKRDQMYVTEKKEKMDKDELQTHLFRAFEKQPYWSVKELEQQTGQPSNFIREVVREICNFNQSGPHRNLYSLKTEYHPQFQGKKSAGAASGAGSSTAGNKRPAEEDDDDDWEKADVAPTIKTEPIDAKRQKH